MEFFNRGLFYYELDKYDEAIKDFDKAIELDPKNSNNWKREDMLISKT